MPTFKSKRTSVMVFSTFSSFNKCHLVIIPQGERNAIHFVNIVYEGTLIGFYFMHDHPHKLVLREDGALVHHAKLA